MEKRQRRRVGCVVSALIGLILGLVAHQSHDAITARERREGQRGRWLAVRYFIGSLAVILAVLAVDGVQAAWRLFIVFAGVGVGVGVGYLLDELKE